jgi:hypothetical protein
MVDPKPEPVSFYLEGQTRYAFGDRWQFGIECEVQDCDVDPWGTLQPFGSFWLWVGGRAIGNTDVSEQLTIAFSQLRSSARFAGKRSGARFPGMSNVDKLDFVRWVGWGEDHEFCAERWGHRNLDEARAEDVGSYWVVPPGHSPSFDNWEVILLEEETTETLIWRYQKEGLAECEEATVPSGTFAEICLNACDWFDRLQVQRMGSTLREPEPDQKPRFLPRIY